MISIVVAFRASFSTAYPIIEAISSGAMSRPRCTSWRIAFSASWFMPVSMGVAV